GSRAGPASFPGCAGSPAPSPAWPGSARAPRPHSPARRRAASSRGPRWACGRAACAAAGSVHSLPGLYGRAGRVAKLRALESQEPRRRRRSVAGNWKLAGSRDLATALVGGIVSEPMPAGVELVVLPPLPYLGDLVEDFERTPLAFGAQDVSSNEQGAYTGEVSARMLVDVGAKYGLVGHSERRQYHAESSELVALKFRAAVNAGLRPILCLGEGL